jgi:hypothetical protein
MEGRVSQKAQDLCWEKGKNLFLAGKRSLKNGGTGQKCKQKHWSAEIPQKLSFIFLSQRREYKFFKT